MDISQAEIAGPCRITFGGIDLGHTLGGVLLTNEREFADVRVDKYAAPIDKVLTGNNVFVNFTLAQPNFRALDVALPETSSYDGAGALDRNDLGGDTGFSLRGAAQQLVIHPLKNADSDTSDDVVIYKAASHENVELPFRIDEQKVVEITMASFTVEDYGPGRRLGHIGVAAVS